VTPLFFLHGVGGSHAVWDRQLPYFAARGYQALAWDQPGYGGAPAVEPYDLERIAGSLAGISPRRPSSSGCMGGASRRSGPRAVWRWSYELTVQRSAARNDRAATIARGAADAGQTMAQIAARLIPSMRGTRSRDEGVAQAERVMAQVPADTYRKAVRLLTSFDRRADLPRIRVPTLLVAGSDDRVAPASVMERMTQKIPGAEFVQLEGCGHLGPMDQPDPFNEALAAFLQRRQL
jgi:pimeloyl-ACP methyl ester carboxylesterase